MASPSIPAKRLRAFSANGRFALELCIAASPSRNAMIRKLKSGEYRLYSRKKNPKTGKRRNLGTFNTREAAVWAPV